MGYTRLQVATAVAQVRKWLDSRDNGWAPTRPQARVLADTVEGQRLALDRAYNLADTADLDDRLGMLTTADLRAALDGGVS